LGVSKGLPRARRVKDVVSNWWGVSSQNGHSGEKKRCCLIDSEMPRRVVRFPCKRKKTRRTSGK